MYGHLAHADRSSMHAERGLSTVSVYFAHKTMAEETDNCLEDLLPTKVMSRSELDTESDVIALAR